MQAQISVIIPIYNVEAYLQRCVESVLCQSYENLEIILVDDGSPDGCPQLCDMLATRDARIRVIHKENGGLSSARNAGIREASGDYIGFVDSDDYILPNMYATMLRAILEDASDLCICAFQHVDEGGNPLEGYGKSGFKREKLTREQAYERLNPLAFPDTYYVTAPNKLYRKELFGHMRFPEGRLHEDEFIAHHIFAACTSISIVEEAFYKYVQRGGSIMNDKPSIKRLDGVYALMDRYVFFKKEKYNTLSKIWLKAAYQKLIQYTRELGYGRYAAQLRPAVWAVMKELIRNGDLRAAKLALICLQSAITQKGKM